MRLKKNKTTRNQYGLSQQQIADWIGVSRSHLAHYECHRRELPPVAKEKYNELFIMMAKMETGKRAESRQPHPESLSVLKLARQELASQQEMASYKVLKMKKDFLAIRKKYTQTRDLIELLEKMMKVVTKEKNKMDFLWLQIQYDGATTKLLECDESVQLGIMLKIAALEAVVNFEF